MKIIPVKGPRPKGSSVVVYGSEQEQYLPLPALRLNDEFGTVRSFWKLTVRERFILLFRGVVCLDLLTFHKPIQPQKLFVLGMEE
jgi:hypothetical protein